MIAAVSPVAAAVATAIVAAISHTVTLGSVIVGVIVGAATLFGVLYGAKYKVSYEAAAARGDELEKWLKDERARHEEAATERRELQELVVEQKQTIERLSKLEDIARVIDLMNQTFERVVKHVGDLAQEHEKSAQGRHVELLAAVHGGRV